MDTDSFIVYIEAKGIYVDITEDDGTRINTSNYEIDRLLPKEKDIKVIGFRKINQVGKNCGVCYIETKNTQFLIDDNNENEKAKVIKK